MLLQAVEIGLNGLCIRAFDREGIKRALGLTLEPVLVMALGRSVEKAETVEIPADGNHAYYRRDGRHIVAPPQYYPSAKQAAATIFLRSSWPSAWR